MTLLTSALAAVFATLLSPAAAAPPSGTWVERGQLTTVRFDKCGPGVCGRLVYNLYLKADPRLRDVNNPDPALRTRPIQNLVVFQDLRRDGADWRGRAYLPSQGRTYPVSFTPDGPARLRMDLCVAPGDCHPAVWERRPD